MRATKRLQRLAMTLALPLSALVIGGEAMAQTESSYLTGCLTDGGNIVKLAYGEIPAKPCQGTQAEVKLALEDEDGGSTGYASILTPFYITLDGDTEATIAINGPLEYFARCTVDAGGRDKIEILATSTEDGWWDEDGFWPLRADDEVLVFLEIGATGQSRYDNDTNEGSAVAADGSYIAIDGDTLGLGLNVFGHDCIAVGTVIVITGTP